VMLIFTLVFLCICYDKSMFTITKLPVFLHMFVLSKSTQHHIPDD